ncbi:zinc-binding dehydrogenase [Ruoffia tabacinasalis]|uniref:Zinc-binding dehydrogenase n=1 Tax=Ruoffia tabacinasalis TaxID=87458 RepID=A0A5R9DXA8_9LACT|nr:zinc-binding dehydrogenase [Ruoffia tabacinasalis]TLQ41801.1 zinc-binding dehydrogenase [Ruoffia tabacinasalis]
MRVLTQGPILSKLWNRKIQPVIDRVIPFEEVNDDLKALEGGQVLGKIVVKMN